MREGISLSKKIGYEPQTADPTLKALIFLGTFPTFGGVNCHR